jgi:hypothetical protein
MKEAAAREAAFTVAEMAAIAPVDDDKTIEGKTARRPARRRGQAQGAARGAKKAKPAGPQRRGRRATAPDSPA